MHKALVMQPPIDDFTCNVHQELSGFLPRGLLPAFQIPNKKSAVTLPSSAALSMPRVTAAPAIPRTFAVTGQVDLDCSWWHESDKHQMYHLDRTVQCVSPEYSKVSCDANCQHMVRFVNSSITSPGPSSLNLEHGTAGDTWLSSSLV